MLGYSCLFRKKDESGRVCIVNNDFTGCPDTMEFRFTYDKHLRWVGGCRRVCIALLNLDQLTMFAAPGNLSLWYSGLCKHESLMVLTGGERWGCRRGQSVLS